ncbi:NUDIX hydrolase [Candidatus Woesebacteria bacterium]|nr:NUDIX hydrolase [Candidatus Woesebacteria bacterium]
MAWKTLSSKKVYENRYIKVYDELLETEHGDKLSYGIVRKEPFSVVIPWDGEKTLLVGQYRPTADYFSWEFPMGHAESDDPLTAAKKELKEETGLIASDCTEIGQFYPALGTMNQLGYVYVVRSWQLGERSLEDSEKGMQEKWVTLSELEDMIEDGTIKDGPTITSIKFFEFYLNK